MKAFKFILLAILVGGSFFTAEATVKVMGAVTDACNGEPLPGAHLRITDTNWMTIVDEGGRFVFRDLPAGNYRIVASHIGYAPAEKELSVFNEGSAILNISLKPKLMLLPEVTIEASSPNVVIYTADEIKKISAEDLAAFLNQTGEFTILDGGGAKEAGITIRGAKPEQIAVYLDGHRLNDPRTGGVDLKTVPVNSLDRIVIRRNPDLTMGASGPGGAVELYSAGIRGKALKFGFGSYGRRSCGVEIGEEHQNFGFNFSFNRTASDGNFKYHDPDTDLKETRLNDDYLSDNLYLNLSGSLFRGSDFSVSFHHLVSERGAPGGTQNPDTLDRINSASSGIAANFGFYGEKWSCKTRVSYYETETENIDYFSWSGSMLDFSSRHRTVAMEADSRLTRKDSLGHSTMGVSYRVDEVSSSTLEGAEDRRDFGVYFRRALSFHRFRISSTVRGDAYRHFGTVLSSSLGGRVNPAVLGSEVALFANWSRGFNLPTFNQLFWAENVFAAPNPELEPERMESSDLGVEWNAGILSLRTTYFIRKIDDLIIWRESCTQGGKKWKPVNTDEARISGWEFNLKAETEAIVLTGAATLSDPRNLSEDYRNKFLTFRPEVQTGEALTFRRSGWETTLSHRYLSRRYILEANTKWEEPISVYDLSVGKSFNIKNFESLIRLRINNLLDEEYSIIHESPMPGRNYSAKITVNLK